MVAFAERPAVRFAALSFLTSFVILAMKLGAWWSTSSTVLLADAAESGLDVVTALLLVLAVEYASRPPDARHPWGHGKIEYFSTGFQGALVLAAGISIGLEVARGMLVGPVPLELSGGLWLSGLATLLNVGLSVTLIQQGRALRSPALEADGFHNLSDVVTTVGGWVGLGLAWLTGVWLLDPLVALLVAGSILFTGVRLLRGAVDGLMDASIDAEDRETLLVALNGVLDGYGDATLGDLRARESSRQVFVDCIVHLPGTTSVADAHAVCDALEEAGRTALPGAQIHVHVEPTDRSPSRT